VHLYHDLYRCVSCSEYTDPNGVAPFTNPGAGQTIPVSHFGNIDKSKIWVVFNNPKGDKSDPNVGATPRQFGAEGGRLSLSATNAQKVKEHFDRYFTNGGGHKFFEKWKTMLNGLNIKGEVLTFENGRICAVDLIKCPTVGSFMGYVMKPEGQQVWDNCLRDPQRNKFLLKQIEHHTPPVIIFAGTQTSVKGAWKGDKDKKRVINIEMASLIKKSSTALIKDIWTMKSPQRLSFGLQGQRKIESLDNEALCNEKNIIQSVIDKWLPLTVNK
jgi:hypothetical protein